MTDARGGFYSAEDADSEGEEGKFYLWTEEEIRSLLSQEEADLCLSVYRHPDDLDLPGMREFPAGHFILHRQPVSAEESRDVTEAEEARLAAIGKKLLAAREKRVSPHKDDKILADWNGLMIAALARGAQVFDDPDYAAAALRAMRFITERMTREDEACGTGTGTGRRRLRATLTIMPLSSGRFWNSTKRRWMPDICLKRWNFNPAWRPFSRMSKTADFF
jgi:uncharacterized protein YyaL (SSP411 family)